MSQYNCYVCDTATGLNPRPGEANICRSCKKAHELEAFPEEKTAKLPAPVLHDLPPLMGRVARDIARKIEAANANERVFGRRYVVPFIGLNNIK